MIFFAEKIKPYRLKDNSILSPVPCKLKTGESGFFLNDGLLDEIKNKVSSIKNISKDDLEDV